MIQEAATQQMLETFRCFNSFWWRRIAHSNYLYMEQTIVFGKTSHADTSVTTEEKNQENQTDSLSCPLSHLALSLSLSLPLSLSFCAINNNWVKPFLKNNLFSAIRALNALLSLSLSLSLSLYLSLSLFLAISLYFSLSLTTTTLTLRDLWHAWRGERNGCQTHFVVHQKQLVAIFLIQIYATAYVRIQMFRFVRHTWQPWCYVKFRIHPLLIKAAWGIVKNGWNSGWNRCQATKKYILNWLFFVSDNCKKEPLKWSSFKTILTIPIV
jgi:hypothetical protein